MNLKLIKLQILVCVVLGAILLAEWAYDEFGEDYLPPTIESAKDQHDKVSQLPTISRTNAPITTYTDLVERPLFAEDRKPVVEAPVDTAKPTEQGQIDDWVLIGVFNKDKKPIALFTKKSEAKKYLKIPAEQMIAGWQLKEILSDKVVLFQAGQEKTIMLRKPRTNPPPVAPATKPGLPPKPNRRPATNTNPENANDES